MWDVRFCTAVVSASAHCGTSCCEVDVLIGTSIGTPVGGEARSGGETAGRVRGGSWVGDTEGGGRAAAGGTIWLVRALLVMEAELAGADFLLRVDVDGIEVGCS